MIDFSFFAGDTRNLRNVRRFLTINEALDYLEALSDDSSSESEQENNEFVVIPPDPDVLTDEENIDDNAVGENIPIPKDITGEIDIFSSKIKKSKNNTGKRKKKFTWEKCSPAYNQQPQDVEKHCYDSLKSAKESVSNHLQALEPIDVFLKIFSENLLDHIAKESTKYAHQNNRLNFSLSVPMLKRFIGFLLFTGYSTIPQEKMYWSVADDVNFPLIRSAMSRSVYLTVKQNIHIADNTNLDKSDKLAKVRPLIKILNENFLQFGVFDVHLSIDEQMIPYFGKHSCKMFMKGKPVRFGFKAWCLCSSKGYLYQFDIYTGKSTEKSFDLGLGGDIVMNLLKVLETPSQHIVYFDNFFTSHALLSELNKQGYLATGTVRENRIGECPIIPVKKMKKEVRGTYDVAFDSKNNVTVARWNDNAVVTVLTNWDDTEPATYAKRYSRTEKKTVQVKQPKVIADYNKHMGGVDLLDNFVSNYRINIKGKKWWWPIFVNCIDIAKVNAWKLYREFVDSKTTLLDFQRAIAVSLLKSEIDISSNKSSSVDMKNDINPIPETTCTGRPSAMQNHFLQQKQKDRTGHIITKNPENKRRRCKMCSSQTVTMCKKCNVAVHAKCFEDFHNFQK